MFMSKQCWLQQQGFSNLYHSKQIRKYQTEDSTKSLVHRFNIHSIWIIVIRCYMEFRNINILDWLQKVLNAADCQCFMSDTYI